MQAHTRAEAMPALPIGESIKHVYAADLSADGSGTNVSWNGADNRLELVSGASPGVWTSASIDTGAATLTELTIRPHTVNDADDFPVSLGPFGVPSVAADQWGTYDNGVDDPYVRMVFPPWPDDEQAWIFELRTSLDDVVWTDWEPIAMGGSISRIMRYAQIRVTMTRKRAPSRPAIASITLVATN